MHRESGGPISGACSGSISDDLMTTQMTSNPMPKALPKSGFDLRDQIRFLLGAAWCFLKKYDLYNFDFDFSRPVFDQQDAGKNKDDFSWFARKMRSVSSFYLTSRYYQMKDGEREQFLQDCIWGGRTGENWHRQIEDLYAAREDFLMARKDLVDGILSLPPESCAGIVEMGAGNGWFLDLLTRKIQRDIRFTGLDLSEETTQRARVKYRDNPRLDFQCARLSEFAKRSSLRGTVIAVCFVLEYFSKKELGELADLLKKHAPCYLAMFERVHADSPGGRGSFPIGWFSYSHDYEKVFKASGMKEIYSKLDPSGSDQISNLTAIFQA
jgi:hypothetical protein